MFSEAFCTEMNMVEYINEFEKRYNKIKAHNMELPTAVLAYRLLKSANISSKKQQLVRATLGSLTFDNMKKQLKAIYESCGGGEREKGAEIKVELDVFYSKSEEAEEVYYGNWRSRGRGHGRVRYRGGRGWGDDSGGPSYDSRGRKLNPLDANGNPSKCSICQSIFHWVRDCKEKVEIRDQPQQQHQPEFQVQLLCTKELHKCYIEKFVGETLNSAVLDSGCTKTVCGETWLQCYLEGLSETDLCKVKEFPTSTRFKFGDGEPVTTCRGVEIPSIKLLVFILT